MQIQQHYRHSQVLRQSCRKCVGAISIRLNSMQVMDLGDTCPKCPVGQYGAPMMKRLGSSDVDWPRDMDCSCLKCSVRFGGILHAFLSLGKAMLRKVKD